MSHYYVAVNTKTNEPSLHGSTERWFDTMEILQLDGSATEFEDVTVESSEDEAPYLAALAAAGWRVLGGSPLLGSADLNVAWAIRGGVVVERATP